MEWKQTTAQLIEGSITRTTAHRASSASRIDNLKGPSDFSVPANFEDGSEDGHWFHLNKLMLTVILIALGWIGLLTYLVWKMPQK